MRPDEDDMKEFVTRCGSERFQGYVEQTRKDYHKHFNDKWKKANPEKHKECRRKYEHSEKGQVAAHKRSQTRQEREKEASKDLTWEEKRNIQNFYRNCPKGHCVDHIIPIGKGGKHELSNLQYLTHLENFKKGTEIWQKIPHIIYYLTFGVSWLQNDTDSAYYANSVHFMHFFDSFAKHFTILIKKLQFAKRHI